MRAITFSRSAAGISSWTADRDVVLQCVTSAGTAKVLVSTSPAATAADLSAPGTTQLRNDAIFYCGDGNIAAAVFRGMMEFPVRAGEVVYVQLSAAGSAVLYMDDAPPAE